MSEEQKVKWYNSFTREQLIERCEYLQRSCERKEDSIIELEMENADLESIIKEIERQNNIIKTKDEGFKASIEELTDYANRIDKALEYIKEYLYINEETGEYCLTHTFDDGNLYELMKILKENKI